MLVRYNEDFKVKVVKAYMEGDKTLVELSADYNVAKSTIREWKKYGDECQHKYTTAKTNESDSAIEIRRLNQELKEKEKEIAF